MLKQLTHFLQHGLWQGEPGGRQGRWVYPALRITVVMVQELLGGQLTLRAMSLVYTTLLSLVPLLAVSFSVLKAFGVHNQVEPLLLQYLEPLGTRGEEITLHILAFVDNMKVGVLGSVGVGLLMYTVISLTQKVESAFNYVWRVTRTRSLPRRFSDYLSVILVGPVLVFSSIGLTASLLHSSMAQTLMALPVIGGVITLTGKMVPYLLIILAFTFVYMFVPNTKVHLRSALVGAVVSGILWETSGLLFATFVANSTRYAAIYSGFAILMFFMIWLYLSWFILLFGAQISYFHQHPEQIRLQRDAFRLSNRMKERAGLALMFLVADAFVQGRGACSQEALAQHLGLPGDVVGGLLNELVQGGYLSETGDDVPGYLPARDPEQMAVSDLLSLLRQAEEAQQPFRATALESSPVEQVVARLQASSENTLGSLTLKDLVLGRAPR